MKQSKWNGRAMYIHALTLLAGLAIGGSTGLGIAALVIVAIMVFL